MLRHLSVAVLAATAASAVPALASAQGGSCEDAALRVNTSSLPRSGAPEWKDWVTLTGCDARGATVIAGALRADGVRNETELGRLDYLAGILDGWFQPQLISAYQSLLRGQDVSNGMRLRAMWLLSGLYAPDVDVAGPLQGYMTVRCERYDRSTALRDAPATLPAAAYEQARDAIASAADDRFAPEYVRSTARCWEDVLVNELRNGTREVRDDDRREQVVVRERETVIVERPVRVVYECGSRFVFYNDAGYDLAVRYDSYGRTGVLRVAHGGPYVWAAARFGPVRFWLGEREVWYTDAVYRPCGGTRVIVAPTINIWTGWHVGLGVYGSNRGYGPRVVYPRAPRVTRPIIIVNPRDNRWDDNWNGPRGNPRDGRRPEPVNAPRGNPRDDRRGQGNDQPRGAPRGDPRDGRTAVPRSNPGDEPRAGGGQRTQSIPELGPPKGSTPLPRRPIEERPRFAVPRGGGEAAPPPRSPDAVPPRSEGTAQREAKPSGANERSGGERSTPWRGKPASAIGRPPG